MLTKITLEFLTTTGACTEGVQWFRDRPELHGASWQTVCAALEKDGKDDWSHWVRELAARYGTAEDRAVHEPAAPARGGRVIRSLRAEVRNPVLSLPAMKNLLALDPSQRRALGLLLRDLAKDARTRAEHCWAKHKAPMAAYWKAVSVYANHSARAIERAETGQPRLVKGRDMRG